MAVSETTVIRLSYSLGFDSFSAMQQTVRDEILGFPPGDPEAQESGFFQSIIIKEISNLNQILNQIDDAYMESVIAAIMEADQVLAIGARASQGPASWFATTLGHLRANVHVVYPFMEESFVHLAEAGKKSAVICISFSRYSKGTYRYAKVAKEAGAKIISITDSAISPVGKISDYIFITNSNKDEMGFNSFVSTYCICSMIIAGIRKKSSAQIPERFAAFEEVYKKLDIFYE